MNLLTSFVSSVKCGSHFVSPLVSKQSIPLSSLLLLSDPSVQQVRYKPKHNRIRGAPRPPIDPEWRKQPEAHKYNWRPIYPDDGKYTIKPLKIYKLGGRDPETRKVTVETVGGGNKKYFRWVDNKRLPNEDGTVKEEKVLLVRYDPLRTSKLALVGGGDLIRWIIATENILAGDIIRSHPDIPRNPIRPKEGDAYRAGALPIGTMVHNIEVIPGEGGKFCVAAGTGAEIVRRIGKKTIIKLPYRREIAVDEKCMLVVGRVSNIYHYTLNLMCAQRSRWLGKRPRSGAFHRKDGYCGRKIRPPKPLLDFTMNAIIGQKKEQEIYEVQPY